MVSSITWFQAPELDSCTISITESCMELLSYLGYILIYICYLNLFLIGKILLNSEIISHVADIFRKRGGSDAWFSLPIIELLPKKYRD